MCDKCCDHMDLLLEGLAVTTGQYDLELYVDALTDHDTCLVVEVKI